jgi:hypothetical protein
LGEHGGNEGVEHASAASDAQTRTAAHPLGDGAMARDEGAAVVIRAEEIGCGIEHPLGSRAPRLARKP